MKRFPWLLSFGVLFLCVVCFAAHPGGSSELPQAPEPLADCWQDLAAADAGQAYRALWRLVQQPAPAVQLLDKHLSPAAAPDAEKVRSWLADLGDAKFAVRDKAFKELENLGELAEPALKKALKNNPELETKRRIELLLNRLAETVRSPEKVRMIRAVEVLEMLGTAEARGLLQRLAAGFPPHRLTQEAQETLQRLKQRSPFKGWPAVAANGNALPFGARARLGTTLFRHRSHTAGSMIGFGPEGRFLASMDEVGTAYLWETTTGKLHRQYNHGATCGAVAPTGTLLALTSRDQESIILLWDWRDNKELGRLALLPGVTANRLWFSPDGGQLFAVYSDRSLCSWDLQTRKETKLYKPATPKQVVAGFAPTGTHVIVAEENSPKPYLLDVQKGTKHPLGEIDRYPQNLAFSPDGKYLATLDYGDVGLAIWEVATAKLRWMQTPGSGFYGYGPCAFSADGKILAASEYRKGISLWNTSTGKFLRKLPGSQHFRAAAISADGRWLAGAGEHGVRVWDLETGQPIADGDGHVSTIHDLAFSPRFDAIASAGDDGSVRLWDPLTGKQKHLLLAESEWVRALTFSPDGKWLASSDHTDAVRLWDVAAGKQVYKLPGHGWAGGYRVVQFSADAGHLASWGDDFYLRRWDVKTGKALVEHRTRPRGFDIPEDDEEAERALRKVEIGPLGGMAFTPHADQFVMTSGLGNLHFFDVATGKETRVVEVGFKDPQSLAISPTGKHYVVSSYGFQLTCGHLPSGKVAFSISYAGSWGRAAFSPDGRTVAATSGNKVALVEMATGRIRLSMEKLPARSRTVTFSPDGRLLVTAHEDTTALVWDVAVLAGKS
jgi:WD40 repeat protein